MEKLKVIIDTDPGVDDIACLTFALFDPNVEVKLLTTVAGNIAVEKCTRNLLHVLNKYGLDYPVAEGAKKALYRDSINATFIHQKEGLGGYTPPKFVPRNILKDDAAEMMYKVLSEGDGDIVPILLGPQTNMALLLKRHPDIIKKIPKIYFMGGAPYGVKGFPEHLSFNLTSDPEAFKIVIDSKIPLVMIPSNLGRNQAHYTEDFVYQIRDTNEVGKFLYQMYTKYWEPGYNEKRISTNDTCTFLALTNPELFITDTIDVEVDTEDQPGRTYVTFKKDGQCTIIMNCHRDLFLKEVTRRLKSLDNVKVKP